ncbi:MAG: glycosyl transferase family 1 [Bacteroidota bacterium]
MGTLNKKVCILTQSHLCRNPRVVKEAVALDAAGFIVVIITTFTYPDLLAEDLKLIENTGIILKGAVNLIPSEASSWYRLRQRLVRRAAGEAISRFGLENVYALGYDYHKNLRAAIGEQADLYTCHQEVSTVIGCRLIRKGFRVAFDIEDWYSHDLLPEANRSRPIKLLEESEKFALQNGILCYTTSQALADALGKFAGTGPPKVLQNVFPFSDRDNLDRQVKDRVDRAMPSIHWYSQTIGPGRGIEFLIESLADVDVPLEFHLRGRLFEGFQKELMNKFPGEKGHRLYFHQLVPHTELLSRIAEHDIGLATEEYQPDSRNLTITNKILQYLQGGIAVVATDTAGQQEVAREALSAVFLFRNKDRQGFAGLLNSLLKDPGKLAAAKQAAVASAREKFCWEKQEPMLVRWITDALTSARK